MIDESKLLSKPGGSKFAPTGGVTDKILLDIASQYETAVSRKMTAVKPDELPKRFQGTEPILETNKYDGEGVFVYYEDGKEPFAFNAWSGRVRLGLPVLGELKQLLKKQGLRKALLRAELYLPDVKDGKRSGIADVIRVSFSGTEADLAKLRLAMLDVVMLDGKDMRPNQEHFQDSWQLLEKLFGPNTERGCHRALGSIVPENQVNQAFATRTGAGSEGLVIRRLNRADLIKVKPHITVDAAVLGYVEGEFEGQYGVTSILAGLTYPNKQDKGFTFQTLARVGSGLTDSQRTEFKDLFSSIKTDAPIAMTDSDGRAVNFVKPQYVLEVEGDDLLVASGSRENRTQLFGWDTNRFSFKGLVPCPRLTFPIFARLRADKEISSGGARLEQIIKNPVLPSLEQRAAMVPEILRREVYTKAEAVRKLVIVRQSAENCVPFLVYWTDFSARRKDPLKVSSAFAFTEARANALAEQLLTENITKGFVRSDGTGPGPVAAVEAEGEKPGKPKKARKAAAES
ncbi:MAG TPA: hypothetical protein VLT36_10825 [Candidatus Dormibacteraeota bacterium]|nr:hypothetical protein [Candidatus Dormibacteraeota bacterium]